LAHSSSRSPESTFVTFVFRRAPARVWPAT
jgi:hypothetical protein